MPKFDGKQAQSAKREQSDQFGSAQSRQRASALAAFGMLPSAQHVNVAQSQRGQAEQLSDFADTDQPPKPTQSSHAVCAEAQQDPQDLSLNPISNSSSEAVVPPLRSTTSVAALRQSFEERGLPTLGLVDAVKPRNRLPLRKVSSKAQVVQDDGSPQVAALLWQQSLRGEHDDEDSLAEHHADHAQTQSEAGSQKAHGDLYLPGMPLHAFLYSVCFLECPVRFCHPNPCGTCWALTCVLLHYRRLNVLWMFRGISNRSAGTFTGRASDQIRCKFVYIVEIRHTLLST